MLNTQITYLEKLIHEVNTPITNIMLLSEIMLSRGVDLSSEDQRQNMWYINESINRIAKISKMLSSVAIAGAERITLNKTELDLIEVIKQEIVYHNIRSIPSEKVKLSLCTSMDSCKAQVDEFWFKQLLANLIINSINHTEEGVVEVRTVVFEERGNEYFHLVVSDEGCGIPESELETIFLLKVRGSNNPPHSPGSGLGLTVSKEIVEAHGGRIWARNAEVSGAIFEVVVPLR